MAVLKKLFQLFLLLSILQPSAVWAQPADTVLVSSRFEEQPLSRVISDLENIYNVQFHYKPEWLTGHDFSGTFRAVELPIVLNRILQETGLIYVIIDRHIVLMPRDEVAYISGEMVNLNGDEHTAGTEVEIGNSHHTGRRSPVTLSGTVRDGATGEPLTGATILVENTDNNTISSRDGSYRLQLHPGSYTLSISSMGFEQERVRVKITGSGEYHASLFEKKHELDEIVVYAQQADHHVRSHQMSMVELDMKSIKQLPSLIGDRDILKSFTMMPGVKSVGEFGSGINVRGGGEDQNLYLIENAPVFNTSHVMGLLSVINPDAVHNVSLYKGHIPARYGERVSSVMDISLQNHHTEKFRGKGGIGLYNSRLLLEGPVGGNKVTYKIGGRTSYSDILLKRMSDYHLQNSSARFHDLTANVSVALKNNPLNLFGYYSNDFFNYAGDFSYRYGNKMGSADWSHIFNSHLSSSVTLAYSHYYINRKDLQSDFEDYAVYSAIDYLSGKIRITYERLAGHRLEAGVQGIQYKIEPGEKSPVNDSKALPFDSDHELGYETAVYINDVYTISPSITLQLGLRFSRYSYAGPATIYQYATNSFLRDQVIDSTLYGQGENIVTYQNLEPRLAVKYQVNDRSSVKFSYNRNSQYLNLLSYTSISTPEDVWKLSDPFLKPVIADQFVLGYYRNFLNNRMESSVEIYYKELDQVIEYKNGAQLALNNHVEQELTEADGYNYGVELYLKKRTGKLDGWLSYTFSRSLRQTHSNIREESINRNAVYPSSYDKPHDLTANLNYHENRRLRFGTNFNLSSGRAVTLPEYVFRSGTHELVYYSDRNKYRLPMYHRLDVSISLDESLKKSKRWKGSWTLSLLNVYGRKNAYSVFYRQQDPSVLNNYELFSLYKLYLIGRPFPTLTYNIIF